MRWTAAEPVDETVGGGVRDALRDYSPSEVERVDGPEGSLVSQVSLTVEGPTLTGSIIEAMAAVQGATGGQVVGVDADLVTP